MEDNFVAVAGCNDEMVTAIREARASLGDFFKAYLNPQPNQTSFLIKAKFVDSEDRPEYIWLADLVFEKGQSPTGVVANEPRIKGLSYMERVPFLPAQITDWMYMQDGELVGGFTTRVLLRAQSKRGGLSGLLKHKLHM